MKITIAQDNFEKGRAGYKPEAIVIHIAQGTLKGTDSWFGGENLKQGIYSSAHCIIGKNGEVHEYVEPTDTAYHAGRVAQPTWTGIKKNLLGSIINPNKYTIGVECEGFRGELWTENQMFSLVDQVRNYCDDFNIPKDRSHIISHNEITIDKEDMDSWCDEIVKRLHSHEPTITEILATDTKGDLVKLLEKALLVAKNL